MIAGLIAALWRRRRDDGGALTVDTRRHHQNEPLLKPALTAWLALIAATLTGLTVASFLADRSNAANARDPKLFLTITANQWWWDVEYRMRDTSRTIRTANEISSPAWSPRGDHAEVERRHP